MLKLSDENARVLRDAVERARSIPALVGRIQTLYADVQNQIDLRKPRCDLSGRCCRFEAYGHRLFVTTLEIAAFVEGVEAVIPDPSADSGQDGSQTGGACPYQVDKLCSVHSIRPFGCRIFFCDASATQWQQEQYEHFHLRLRELHTELGVPYRYVEWREALRAVTRPAGS